MADTHIGECFFIATGVPATFDKVGYDALTWVEIGGVVEGPAAANTHADIPIPSVKTGRTRIVKGARTGVSSSIVWEDVDGDLGQAALIAAEKATGEYSIKRLSEDQTEYWALSGIVKDLAPSKPNVTNYVGGSVNFVPNYEEVGPVAEG